MQGDPQCIHNRLRVHTVSVSDCWVWSGRVRALAQQAQRLSPPHSSPEPSHAPWEQRSGTLDSDLCCGSSCLQLKHTASILWRAMLLAFQGSVTHIKVKSINWEKSRLTKQSITEDIKKKQPHGMPSGLRIPLFHSQQYLGMNGLSGLREEKFACLRCFCSLLAPALLGRVWFSPANLGGSISLPRNFCFWATMVSPSFPHQ